MLRKRRRVKPGSQSVEAIKFKWLECRNADCFEICLVSGEVGKVLCGRCTVRQAGDKAIPLSHKKAREGKNETF